MKVMLDHFHQGLPSRMLEDVLGVHFSVGCWKQRPTWRLVRTGW
jgi:hypothetical protein